MILALSLNTALDKTLVLKSLRPGVRHLPERTLDLAGGKGVNAARALRLLGLDARVLGFLAGRTGFHIRSLLAGEGIPADWVILPSDESRACITLVHEPPSPTEVNESGPSVARESLQRLERIFFKRLGGCRFVLLCGRIPPGVPPGFYAKLIRAAASRGVPCALDASEPALARGLRAGPDIAKPNRAELAELGLSARPDRWKASLDRLARLGAREVFATLGQDGALMKTEKGGLHAAAPALKGGCPIGSGDTFLAGLVYGRLKGFAPERRLCFAAALASASVRTLGAGLFRKAHLREALARVRVRPF
ncbi:MAG: hexose kinase [Elusimicrobia bacterium]|nr:hexose kinase [Elusimicrobiota bacterium]